MTVLTLRQEWRAKGGTARISAGGLWMMKSGKCDGNFGESG